jgi:hypothetical protein
MRHFLAGWFHGNLTRTHYIVLAVLVAVITLVVFDQWTADRAMDDFVRTH